MITAAYWNPETDSAAPTRLDGQDELPRLLDAVLAIRGGRGHPALELTHPDGSTLTLATDGTRCALVWVNGLGESFHSTGGPPGPPLVRVRMRWRVLPRASSAARVQSSN